jgi:hypothetical protein
MIQTVFGMVTEMELGFIRETASRCYLRQALSFFCSSR